MGKEIYNIINDMTEVLNASQMQKLQEVLVNRLSENNLADYLQTDNGEFLDMFLTAKHLEGCSARQYVITDAILKRCWRQLIFRL